ncbi:MAG: hypothetical protein ACE5OY_06960 [Candidatus Bathyarchaeia archaeon]
MGGYTSAPNEKDGWATHFIVDRVTLCHDGLRGLIVVNDDLPFRHGGEDLVKNLYKSDAEVLHVRSLTELNEVVGKYYEGAVEKAHNRVTAKHDAIVYESYGDIALPWEGIKDLDLVLAVEPGYIHSYEPDKYIAATNLQTELIGEVSAKSLLKFLRSVKTVRVPPYRSGEIVGKIKRKLSSIV